MYTSNPTTHASALRFTTIFDAASTEYEALTGKDLGTHPFTLAIDGHNTADSVLEVFRKQAQAFDKFRKANDKMMAWLTPIVNILFTFSATLGEGIGLVSLRFVYIKQYLNAYFSALLSSKHYFYWDWYPPRSKSTLSFLGMRPLVTSNSGGQGCHHRL